MSFYCLCKHAADEAANYVKDPNSESWDVVLLTSMTVVKTGAAQFLQSRPDHRHYPNVDIFSCPYCGNCIARE